MNQPADEIFQPTAAVLALVFPGLGYLYLRQPTRAAYLALGVLGLVVAGIFIGGIDVVDRQADFWWFIPQAGIGPLAFFLDWLRHGPLAASLVPSVSRVNEVGTLYVVMAGMTNAIAVIDCAWHESPSTGARRLHA
jgi:hypothetical protein